MDYMKDGLQAVGTFLVFVLVYIVGLFLAVGIGYFLGMVLAVLPFIGDWLTEGVGLTEETIPTITAWIAVVRLFFSIDTRGSEDN